MTLRKANLLPKGGGGVNLQKTKGSLKRQFAVLSAENLIKKKETDFTGGIKSR